MKPEIRTLRRHHTQRGSVYVIALLTLSVLAMFAAVLGWGAIIRTQQAQKRENSRHLETLIQSGITYASWQKRYRNRSLPFNFSLNMGSGQVDGRVEALPDFGDDAMKVRVNAQYKDAQMTKERIISGAKRARQTTEFALFIDNSLYVRNGTLKVKGDIHVNGQIVTQDGWQVSTEGSITSAGDQIGDVVADTYLEKFTPSIPGSVPTLTELRMLSTQLFTGSSIRPFGMNLGTGDIQYVQGDLRIQGELMGTGIVVVEGDLIFTGKTWYGNSRSLFVFVAQNDIVIPSETEIVGYLISKSGNVIVGRDSVIDPGGLVIIDGSLEAAGDLVLIHDPRVNADFFRQLSRVVEIDNAADTDDDDD